MGKVISKDGTKIAYDRIGQGPTLVLVDGALAFRAFGSMPELAKLLSPYFTVVTYDRRGRGESGETKPFAVEREIEDIEALIDEFGSEAYLYGMSSGGCLAIEATIKLGERVKKLALYEPPYNDNNPTEWKEYTRKLKEFLDANLRGDAAALFMAFVGTPAEQINGMRKSPIWSIFESEAPTLWYDAAAMGGEICSVPIKKVSTIRVPTLIMNGAAGASFMKETALTLSKAIPNAKYKAIEGQTHAIPPETVAPVLIEFFKS